MLVAGSESRRGRGRAHSRLPVAEEDLQVVFRYFFAGELVRVRIARGGMRSRTRGIIFGVMGAFGRSGFSGMPLAPAGGLDVRAHFGYSEKRPSHTAARAARERRPSLRAPQSGGSDRKRSRYPLRPPSFRAR